MKTISKLSRVKRSIELQKRTLANLQEMNLADGGKTIELTRQIIAQLESQQRLLEGISTAPIVRCDSCGRGEARIGGKCNHCRQLVEC